MKVKLKKFESEVPTPIYHTDEAAAFDFTLRFSETIAPKEIKLLATGIGLKFPPGYFLFINSRSSTMRKYGLLVIPGIGDSDYCGDSDEYFIQVMNLSNKTVELPKGTRIAQGILMKYAKADFELVTEFGASNRTEINP